MKIQRIKMCALLFMASISMSLLGIACYAPTESSSVAGESCALSESVIDTALESVSGKQSDSASYAGSASASMNQSENSFTSESSSVSENASASASSSTLEEAYDSSSASSEEGDISERDSSEYSSSQTIIHHHVYELEIERAATCADEGIRHYSCKCGTDYTEKIPKLPHQIVVDEERLPTCVKTGVTAGSHCSACDVVCVAQEIIPMVEHTFLHGYCQICDLVGLEFTINNQEKYAICSKITGSIARRVVIPDEYCGYPVVEVAPSLFENHYELYSVEIGKNVKKIGEGAFHQCMHLVEVYDRSDARVSQNPLLNGSLLSYVEDDDVYMAEDIYTSKIEIIDECVIFHDEGEHVMIDYQGNQKKVIIPEGVTAIDSFTFSRKPTVREVVLPSTLNRIAIRAFFEAFNIESIIFKNQKGWQGRKEDTHEWVPVAEGHLTVGIENRNALIEKHMYVNYDWRRIEEEGD